MPDLEPKTHRLESIDFVRGFVMVIMALDHVRDYFHLSTVDPMGPEASLPLYLSRLITNICAPAFLLLAGVSIGLMATRKSKPELSRFLLSRGLWLILIEATVVTFSWKFNFSNNPGIALSVIWAIGVAMVVLSLLIHLKAAVVCGLGIVIVAGHNLLDPLLPSGGFGVEGPLWLSFHRPLTWLAGDLRVDMPYPTLAWTGVMACGFGLARVFSWEADRRGRFLLRLGGGLMMLFVVLRWSNFYGDSRPWVPGDTAILTLRDFLNVGKYPPSFLIGSGPSRSEPVSTYDYQLEILRHQRRRSGLHCQKRGQHFHTRRCGYAYSTDRSAFRAQRPRRREDISSSHKRSGPVRSPRQGRTISFDLPLHRATAAPSRK